MCRSAANSRDGRRETAFADFFWPRRARRSGMEIHMTQYLIILLTGLIFSACGFYMYIYFFSLGYGFSIAAIGAVMLILFRSSVTWGTGLQCLLFIIYGIRLGGYLLIRELKSPAYKKVLSPELQRSKQMGMVPKVSIWISCALLYTLEVSPVFFRLLNGDGTSAAVVAGLIIMVLGICLEMAADLQKTAAKKKNPYRFVDSGLYRIVRCPNYLGELLLWRALPQLSGRTASLAGRADLRVWFPARDRAVGSRHPWIYSDRLYHVQRCPPPGNPPGPQLRRGSGVSQIRQNCTDPHSLHSTLQC